MASSPHNRILKAVAHQALDPIGLTQLGRSRTWLDDRGWWVGVVEFQPSSFGRGSYLNVGAHWLWAEAKDWISFDAGERRVDDAGFATYNDDQSFESWTRQSAGLAAERIRALRKQFPDVTAVAKQLTRRKGPPGWPTVDAGIALGLTGKAARAIQLLRSLSSKEDDPDWWHEGVGRAHEYAELLAQPGGEKSFGLHIAEVVRWKRSILKLNPQIDLPWG